MKFIVNYMPENLSETQCQMIRDNINESMSSNESCQYATDMILEMFGKDQAIVDACEGCDYLEL